MLLVITKYVMYACVQNICAVREISLLDHEKGEILAYKLVVVLLIFWAFGLVTSYTAGGFIHLILLVTLVILVIDFVIGRRTF
jgi:hypothetical protein